MVLTNVQIGQCGFNGYVSQAVLALNVSRLEIVSRPAPCQIGAKIKNKAIGLGFIAQPEFVVIRGMSTQKRGKPYSDENLLAKPGEHSR